ncbi:hypothetical protein [Anaeromyxobacter oryzae]|uniref:Uncharacterized protein n=1 Tax=Anaeromyxobacter oryzae TaxID=2918170 RepID=A0ABN6N0I2_9BACT|nr:hypothetical protein [Anaeromyxobacter oryzae]BDG06724.1 hypothetical protein AMOR_57200 [Anaeromyxobacter oryzae]
MSRSHVPLVALLLALAAPTVPLAAGAPDDSAPQAGSGDATPAGATPSTEGAPAEKPPAFTPPAFLPEAAAPAPPPPALAPPAPGGTSAGEEPSELQTPFPEEPPAFVPPAFTPGAAAPAPPPPALAPPARSKATAEEKPASKLQTPPPESQPAAAGPPSPFAPEDTWWDVGHAFLEAKMFAPVFGFDRFFSDERELELERSRSFLRFRSEVRFREDGAPVFGVSLRADLRLPGLAHWLDRFRLVIARESEDTSSTLFPNDPTATPLRPGSGRGDAELRYGLWDGLLSHLDLGAGVLMELPPGVFTRLRYRTAVPVSDWVLMRFAGAGFWRTDTLFGTSGAFELVRPLGPVSLARVGTSAELSQRSLGIEWASDLSFVRTIGPRRAISVGAGMEGATRSPVGVDRYRVYTRLRREVWRRWIFAEIEPEIGWPWDPIEKRRRVIAATLRLEVQFQGRERSETPDQTLWDPVNSSLLE